MCVASIIIPVYNSEQWIEHCVASILAQENADFEVLLINDGSTDSSMLRCVELAKRDKRIKVFSQENAGPSCARNLGLKNANGKWISFVDSDDWVDADFLNVIEEATDCDIIYFGLKEIKDRENEKKHICLRSFDASRDIDSTLVSLFESESQFFGYSVNKFFRKDIIRRYGLKFDENLRIKEDEEFCIRYCRYISSLFVSSATPYNYRIMNNSLSHSSGRFNNYDKLADTIEHDLEGYPFGKFRRSVLNRLYFYRFDALVEACDQSVYIDYVNKWDGFYKRNRKCMNLKSKLRFVHWLPKCVRRSAIQRIRPFRK